ncbi:MAG: proteasome assembly chaperone family protein [Methanomicrobiales archaeon]
MRVKTETDCCTIVAEDIEKAVVLEGSPGVGLIGNIVGWLLVEDLKMKEIGYIESKHFPPLAVLYKGVAIHPFRIYESDGIVLFLSDFIVPPNVVYDMTTAIVEWMDKNNSKELITFNSMIVKEKTQTAAGAANSPDAVQRLANIELPIVPFGNLNGLSGTLLTRCATKNIPASCLFAEILNPYPDPRAASRVINALNTILNLEINPEPLIKEAEEIESRLKKLAEDVRNGPGPESPIYS